MAPRFKRNRKNLPFRSKIRASAPVTVESTLPHAGNFRTARLNQVLVTPSGTVRFFIAGWEPVQMTSSTVDLPCNGGTDYAVPVPATYLDAGGMIGLSLLPDDIAQIGITVDGRPALF